MKKLLNDMLEFFSFLLLRTAWEVSTIIFGIFVMLRRGYAKIKIAIITKNSHSSNTEN
jgi:hypothetical protein